MTPSSTQWNANLYDTKHDFVSKYGEAVIEVLQPVANEKIVDLGCGTGDLSAILHQKGVVVTGIDQSAEMIRTAKEKYPHIKFDLGDAANFSYPETFDAVFSNATLHWVLHKEEAIQCIYNCLKPKGRFVAEFGGKGNVQLIVQAIKKVLTQLGFAEHAKRNYWYFPSIGEYTSLLEKHGFRVLYAVHFDRDTELQDSDGIQNWIKMFGGAYLAGLQNEEIKEVLCKVEEDLKETIYKNGKWYADYKRLRIWAVKE
jgi:trans-aconitate methyltransferase